jgi:hypothetical protein
VTVADERSRATASPARRLQRRLRRELRRSGELDGGSDRWTPRATLWFILGTCGGFWLVVATILKAVFA